MAMHSAVTPLPAALSLGQKHLLRLITGATLNIKIASVTSHLCINSASMREFPLHADAAAAVDSLNALL